MKRFVIIPLILLMTGVLSAQVFPVEAILKNGDPDKRVNFVFLSDGYQQHELDKYITDVNKVLNDIFNQSPFKEYKNYFNVYAIRVPSAESGANHPRTTSDNDCAGVPVAVVNNYFGSSFDIGNIHRLLVPQKNVAGVLAASFPEFDQAFVLVNSPHYGGSGGNYSSSSIHLSSSEVSFHEIGHSFARLSDEYWAGAVYAAEKPNMTQESSTAKVKWKNWLGVSGTGIYPHTESPTWYRPHQGCKMRTLGLPFCPVCRENFVERIHELVNPINDHAPATSNFKPKETGIDFSLDLLLPTPNTLKVEWRKDNIRLAKNIDKLTVPLNLITDNVQVIEAEVTDTSSYARISTHFTSHVYTINWKVTKTASGVEVVSTLVVGKVIVNPPLGIEEVTGDNLVIYPNPFVDQLQISYSLIRKTAVAISIVDQTGRVVKRVHQSNEAAGEYQHTVSFSQQNLAPGMYFVTLQLDKTQVVRKAIRL